MRCRWGFRHRAGEGEFAARVGHLVQKVIGIPELEADFQGVVTVIFVTFVATFVVRLARSHGSEFWVPMRKAW